jgi:hypothetical protein
MRLFEKSYPVDFGVRLGYGYNQLLISKVESASIADAHSLLAGVETSIPIGGAFSLESKFDYLNILVSSAQAKGAMITANTSLVYQFMRHGLLGYGFLYKSANYKYSQKELVEGEISGTYEQTSLGMIFSLGWIL